MSAVSAAAAHDARLEAAPGERMMRSIGGLVAVAAIVATAGCGGRAAAPVSLETALDAKLDCSQIAAERAFNAKRIEDLEDERNRNRVRSLSRVPGALIGNPLSAIALADLSVAIYREIAALRARDKRLIALEKEKSCGVKTATPAKPPEPAAPSDAGKKRERRELTAGEYGAIASGEAKPAPKPVPAPADPAPAGKAPLGE
ncbi:MAG: hypothetical protein MRY74_05720 [Neomegalonema sp.]|nr:hypothetical protein [Neomegalonema sp.]